MRIPGSVMYTVYVIQGRLVAPGALLNYSLMSSQVRKLRITAIFVVLGWENIYEEILKHNKKPAHPEGRQYNFVPLFILKLHSHGSFQFAY